MKTDSNNHWFRLENLPVESFINDIDFIRNNKTRLNWDSISKYKKLTKKFIEEFQDNIVWEYIKLYHNFSERYLDKFKNINWKIVNERVEFIRKYSKHIYGEDYYFKDGWLIIDRDLFLSYTNITKLPDNLKVIGFLDLSYNNISKLPDNLKVGIDLDLSYNNISKLPDNLKVDRHLFLDNNPITKLPDNLEVGGWLNIYSTKITKLPDNLKVGDKIYKDF